MDERSEIHRFEVDGESILLDQKGNIIEKVFFGNIDVTQYVRWMIINWTTGKLEFPEKK